MVRLIRGAKFLTLGSVLLTSGCQWGQRAVYHGRTGPVAADTPSMIGGTIGLPGDQQTAEERALASVKIDNKATVIDGPELAKLPSSSAPVITAELPQPTKLETTVSTEAPLRKPVVDDPLKKSVAKGAQLPTIDGPTLPMPSLHPANPAKAELAKAVPEKVATKEKDAGSNPGASLVVPLPPATAFPARTGTEQASLIIPIYTPPVEDTKSKAPETSKGSDTLKAGKSDTPVETVFTPVAKTSERITVDLPTAARTSETYGHAPDYRWIKGVLDRHYRGYWTLRYCDPMRDDKWGGKVRLMDDARLQGLKDGDVLYVEGELLAPDSASRLEGVTPYPPYRVKDVRMMKQSER